jgi:hypothetical protein
MTLWVILVKEPVCSGGMEHGAWGREQGAGSRGHGAWGREQGYSINYALRIRGVS